MKRRTFIKKSAKTTMLLSCLPVIDLFALDSKKDLTSSINTDPLVENEFQDLLGWMRKNGWSKYINEFLNIPIKIDENSDLSLFTNCMSRDNNSIWLSKTENSDFSGNKLIEPGIPSKSLLYHILASPRVKSNLFIEYPSLKQLDVIENYIYNLIDFKSEIIGAQMMVLAYEYRPAYKVPPFNPKSRNGEESASIVYSRTGIARIGNKPMNFDSESRSFTNLPKDRNAKKSIAVTAARYGLFWVKVLKGSSNIDIMDDSEHPETRKYIQPICKIFEQIDKKIEFGEFHKIEKLKKLSEYTFNKKKIEFDKKNYNYDLPPFTRISSRNDKAEPIGSEHNPGKDFVQLKRFGSSVLLSSIPTDNLVQKVTIGDEIVSFKVDKYVKKWNKHTNRRYSALKLPNEKGHENTNAIISQGLLRKKRRTTGLRSPKIAPLFLNIKYEVKSNSDVIVLNGRTDFNKDDYFEKHINQSYWAQLFQDSICDGCVSARVFDKNTNKTLPFNVTPAFSLVTAPDFFPLIDSLDIRAYYFENPNLDTDEDFYEGATINLSQIRLKANTSIKNPFVKNPDINDSVFIKKNDVTGNTVTAVISNKKKDNISQKTDTKYNFDRDYKATSFLPDTGTGVFFPGWDATYSGKKNDLFLATYGLGSPFPEDMKLCAAANGMWPVTSPDAGRTFQGSLEPLFGKKPNTSIPLLDSEIGYNKYSSFVKDFNGKKSYGWDGEQGPFLQTTNNLNEISVNYTDIGRADYIQNLLNSEIGFDMSILRELDSTEIIHRMDCLRFCIKKVDKKKVWKTKLWLVGAESVDDWNTKQELKCLPKNSIFDSIDFNHHQSKLNINKSKGYFFVFVLTEDEEQWVYEDEEKKRKLKKCNKIWLCQVTTTVLSYIKINKDKISKKDWVTETYNYK